MPAVIMADVWKTTPFVALVLMAGLRSISLSCYEAARIDGAGAWQTLRFIMLPLLKPFIAVALLFRTMDAFRVFDLVWVLTAGAHGTETLSVYIYRLLFRYGEMGEGSTAAVVLFVAVLGMSVFLLRVLKVRVRAGEV
jgi:ABC-type sugar transport system permease subunit